MEWAILGAGFLIFLGLESVAGAVNGLTAHLRRLEASGRSLWSIREAITSIVHLLSQMRDRMPEHDQ